MPTTPTPEAVATWGKIPEGLSAEETAEMQSIIDATLLSLGRHYVISDPIAADQLVAVKMQTMRLWKRRDTPEGVAQFDDVQAMRIGGIDRDVSDLLVRRWGIA